jgi:hypothetical protein
MKKLNSSESLLINSTPKNITKVTRFNLEDRYTYVNQHRMQKIRSYCKETDLFKNKGFKLSSNSSASDFFRFKNDSPIKNEQFNKLIAMNSINYRDLFIDKKVVKFINPSSKVKIYPKKIPLEETKNFSYTIKVDKKQTYFKDGFNVGECDKYTNKKSLSIERKKLDSTLYNNKIKYVKFNYPKILNPIQKIPFESKYDKALFIFSLSE